MFCLIDEIKVETLSQVSLFTDSNSPFLLGHQDMFCFIDIHVCMKYIFDSARLETTWNNTLSSVTCSCIHMY